MMSEAEELTPEDVPVEAPAAEEAAPEPEAEEAPVEEDISFEEFDSMMSEAEELTPEDVPVEAPAAEEAAPEPEPELAEKQAPAESEPVRQKESAETNDADPATEEASELSIVENKEILSDTDEVSEVSPEPLPEVTIGYDEIDPMFGPPPDMSAFQRLGRPIAQPTEPKKGIFGFFNKKRKDD